MTMMDSPTAPWTPSKPDVVDAPASEGVMIALLPITTDWCKIEIPHMTLVYCGTTKDFKPTLYNDLAKDTSMLGLLSNPLTLNVMGVKQFGPDNEKVDALDIQASPELWAMRRAVEGWNASEFPFNPHATIGPVGTPLNFVPRSLAFDRIMCGWGSEKLTFNLKGPRF